MPSHDRRQGSQSRPRRRARWIAAAVLAAAVVASGASYFAFRASAALPGTERPDQGHRHLASADEPHEPYNSDPPTSGPHLAYIAPWGIHARPIPRELQVHNLEDGGVIVQYNCECPDLVAKLRSIVEGYDRFVILAPYPGSPSTIALTAWRRISLLDGFDERRIRAFIEAYRGIDHHQ